MKKRKHHNNDGRRQVKRGTHTRLLKKLAAELGVSFKVGAVDNLPVGHHGSSLECMHPFCVSERKEMLRGVYEE